MTARDHLMLREHAIGVAWLMNRWYQRDITSTHEMLFWHSVFVGLLERGMA